MRPGRKNHTRETPMKKLVRGLTFGLALGFGSPGGMAVTAELLTVGATPAAA